MTTSSATGRSSARPTRPAARSPSCAPASTLSSSGSGGTPERRAAALIYAEGGIGSYGRLSLVHNQMQALGLRNVFADAPARFFEPSLEEIIRRDPEVVILLFDNPGETIETEMARLLAQPELADVAAVRNEAIVGLPFALTASSPVAVEGLEAIADQLAQLG